MSISVPRRLIATLTFTALLFVSSLSASAQTMTLLSADYGVQGNRIDVTCRVQSLVQDGYLHFRITNYVLGGDPAPEQPKEFRLRARDYQGRVQDYNMLEKEGVSLQLTDRGPNCPNTGTRTVWQGRLSDDDQQRFDSYYTRWLSYRQRNIQAESLSMQNRMYDVYNHYGIPNTIPFEQVASPIVTQMNGGYTDLHVVSASYGIPGSAIDVTLRLQSLVRSGHLAVNVNNDSMGADPAPSKHKMLTITYNYRGQQQTLSVRERDDLSLP
jgi:hypothetical protein